MTFRASEYDIKSIPIGNGLKLEDLAIAHDRKWGMDRRQTLFEALAEGINSDHREDVRRARFANCVAELRIGEVFESYGDSWSDTEHAKRIIFMARDRKARFRRDVKWIFSGRELWASIVFCALAALAWMLFNR